MNGLRGHVVDQFRQQRSFLETMENRISVPVYDNGAVGRHGPNSRTNRDSADERIAMGWKTRQLREFHVFNLIESQFTTPTEFGILVIH
jgi:hypothetical protein